MSYQAGLKHGTTAERLACLTALEKKVLWLAAWTIHNANHIRPSRDGLKVGGHQASCASVATLMTALYFDVLQPEDRVAVKPHASPVFHAIQYLFGNQTREKLERFRALGGAQSYPSRTKDSDDVDFSTGSVGLGVGATLFASIVQDYLHFHKLLPAEKPLGRMVSIIGDAELDEGNVFEAMLEGWKHDVRNLWWVIDYNRQSLDRVVSDRLFQKIKDFFHTVGWTVVILKHGKLQQAAFQRPGGEALRQWIDDCSNELYSALTFKGGKAWRERLTQDLGHINGIRALLDDLTDQQLQELMTNLAGHDMAAVLEAFHAVRDDKPHCFIAYTIKGFGLPFAGHKDNHAGLMNEEQMEGFRASMGVKPGEEWEPFAGLNADPAELERFIANVPFNRERTRRLKSEPVPVPTTLGFRPVKRASTQEAFGRILHDLGRDGGPLADRLVTTSPDVTVSTNLGGWVNQRGIFNRADREDVFRSEKVVSMQKWAMSRHGQHIELGIAENNLFLMLTALGIAGPLFGNRLIPVGTVYDPFIARGLDALNYACYQDARFILAGTPSGLTLAPEGGAHQSVVEPLIGLGQPGLTLYEPAYADEVAAILHWGFGHVQAEDGDSLYLRLSTRAIEQPDRVLGASDAAAIIAGGYWQIAPAEGAPLAIAYSGAVAPEVLEAHAALLEEIPGVGVLAVTSADRLYHEWLDDTRRRAAGKATTPSHAEQLLSRLPPGAALITVIDGHPSTLSWLGSVAGHRPYPLGTTKFGESGDIPDLYHKHGLDADAMLDMAALACVDAARRR
ncbi:MAG: transketolase [Alphaproteobacteria bacterium]|nr:transketolase [Alphaproteobacteria bacterium]